MKWLAIVALVVGLSIASTAEAGIFGFGRARVRVNRFGGVSVNAPFTRVRVGSAFAPRVRVFTPGVRIRVNSGFGTGVFVDTGSTCNGFCY